MKLKPYVAFVLFCLVLTAILTSFVIVKSLSETRGDSEESSGSGVVQGIVFHEGLPCRPGSRTSNHCSGAMSGYEVTIYKADGKTVSVKVITDENGAYHADLAAGEYVIYVQNGPFEYNVREHRFVVQEAQVIELNLTVDYGIR